MSLLSPKEVFAHVDGRVWSPTRPLTDEEYLEQLKKRFWAKVDKSPGHGPNGDCWLWLGSKKSNGYGQIISRREGKKVIALATRVCYELTYGPVNNKLKVCHTCDYPSCVNPDHLWLGTHKQNINDAQRKGRMRAAVSPKCGPRRMSIWLTKEQGDVLKQYRREAGLSIYDAGNHLRLNYSHYSRFENGHRPILFEQFNIIYNLVGLNIAALKIQPEQVSLSRYTGSCWARPANYVRTKDLTGDKKRMPVWKKLPAPRLDLYRADLLRFHLRQKFTRYKQIQKAAHINHMTLIRALCGLEVKDAILERLASCVGLRLEQIKNAGQVKAA